MTRYMLDTNICVYIIKRKPEPVLTRLERARISDVVISSITLSELEYGISRSARPEQNRMALAGFLAPIEILAYDDLAAAQYGPLRARLEREGRPIGSLDMLIAAHALAGGCTLLTNNEAEFRRVPDLPLENWTR